MQPCVLINTNSIATVDKNGIRYAALSYCWGNTPALVTTKANIEIYQSDSILLDVAPKTIVDAW
jgi:hypothetical protein